MISDHLTFRLEKAPQLGFSVAAPSLGLSIPGFAVIQQALPEYTGSTVIVPSGVRTTLATSNTSVYSDIIIEPIPSNYGRIAWNGSVLTVS